MAKGRLAAPDDCMYWSTSHLCDRPGGHCDRCQCKCGHRWSSPIAALASAVQPCATRVVRAPAPSVPRRAGLDEAELREAFESAHRAATGTVTKAGYEWPAEPPVLKPSTEWAAEALITIHDPDGWRPNGGSGLRAKSLDEPISYAEFLQRLNVSSVIRHRHEETPR